LIPTAGAQQGRGNCSRSKKGGSLREDLNWLYRETPYYCWGKGRLSRENLNKLIKRHKARGGKLTEGCHLWPKGQFLKKKKKIMERSRILEGGRSFRGEKGFYLWKYLLAKSTI